jgi:amino acid adenylation domain-containing protein
VDQGNFNERLANLSPVKRALLELRLKEQGRILPAEHAIQRRATRGPVPLSFAQQRLWFLHQLQPDSCAYNLLNAMRLQGALNLDALRKAFDVLVDRHEVLRTTFMLADGGFPVQVIGASRSLDLTLLDLSGCPDSKREDELQRLMRETTERPFDLAHDLMLRPTLVKLGPAEHVLLLVKHHISSDGWSSGILRRELATFYEAFLTGKSDPLPDLPIQYADYAVWQREHFQGAVLETLLSYWKQQLDGTPAVLELPTDRPRPAAQTFRGAQQNLVLPLALSESLKELSLRERATLFMTLLAAFKVLLYRYSRQDDIVVGSPIAGRNRAEVEGLIGFFVNTLVLRTDLSGNPSFRELLKRVRNVAMEAYAHQDLPFEKLVKELQPERDLSRNPLFQVMFQLQNAPRQILELPGLTVSPLEFQSGSTRFDLEVRFWDGPAGIISSFMYNTDLFEQSTIARMQGHFQTLVEGIAADPDRRLSELPLLTDAELHQVLVEWNDTKKNYPRDKCIHQLFEAQVERSPDAIAVVSEDQQLTYRELNGRANQLAHYLQELGVRAEVLVGLCVERSLEMVIGVLGILKAGGAYVPLDPGYPKERLAFMRQDAHISVLLTQEKFLDEVNCPTTVCPDRDWKDIAHCGTANPVNNITGKNLAYVLYTSGSTGQPKGVAMEHGALFNLISWQIQSWATTKGAKTLQFASLNFDVSFQEIFTTWCSGGTLALISDELRHDPVALLGLLKAQSVERVFLPFIALQQLAETANGEAVPDSLKEIITAGEQLQVTPPIVYFFSRLEGCQLYNQYGPTESHVVTSYVLTGSPSNWPGCPPIGCPIANTAIYILDQNLNPVPIGVTGELYIGGRCLARGYLNRPDLTAEKFVMNPFNDDPSARLYKTGDLARYLPDGNIEFLGRNDHQVKIRGFRIELGEIEAVLEQHAAVRDAVVLAREDVSGDKRLVGYIVPNQEPTPTPHDLRSYLKEKLPEYMVPSAFVFLESLLLTPNGKVDRRALPAPDENRPELKEAFVKPRTPVEELLAGIWAEVLKLEKVGIHDNFFDLGGHSLLGTKLIAQIQKDFQTDLPLRFLFESPTIAGLAARIEAKGEQLSDLQGERQTYSRVFKLQSGQRQKAIFCFPYAGGFQDEYFNFTRLARLMGADYSFYGLRARGTDGVLQPYHRIEDMAADYVTEIQKVQPHGPYFLLGECGGSPEAYETARQLRTRGEEIALLAVFDSRSPGPLHLHRYLKRRLTARLRFRIILITDSWAWKYLKAKAEVHLREIRPLNGGERLRYLFAQLRKAGSVVSDLRRANTTPFQPVSMDGNGADPHASRHMARARKARYLARSRYRHPPYDGRVTLLVNEEWYAWHRRHDSDSTLGWARLAAGGVEVYKIPGNHETYITENIQVVAEVLEKCLRHAEKRSLEGSPVSPDPSSSQGHLP